MCSQLPAAVDGTERDHAELWRRYTPGVIDTQLDGTQCGSLSTSPLLWDAPKRLRSKCARPRWQNECLRGQAFVLRLHGLLSEFDYGDRVMYNALRDASIVQPAQIRAMALSIEKRAVKAESLLHHAITAPSHRSHVVASAVFDRPTCLLCGAV
eukprot:4285413-Amphidinium_carterae.1